MEQVQRCFSQSMPGFRNKPSYITVLGKFFHLSPVIQALLEWEGWEWSAGRLVLTRHGNSSCCLCEEAKEGLFSWLSARAPCGVCQLWFSCSAEGSCCLFVTGSFVSRVQSLCAGQIWDNLYCKMSLIASAIWLLVSQNRATDLKNTYGCCVSFHSLLSKLVVLLLFLFSFFFFLFPRWLENTWVNICEGKCCNSL